MSVNNEVLIEVTDVSKKFSRNLRKSLYYGIRDVTGALLGMKKDRSKLRKDEFWAVRNISFELKRGECLGLIGHNGAGKSTLLKMLNGLIKPDIGRITMRGKIGALIELGAGFNPVLTGRENIYINGQILGFSKKEIDERLQAIIDFSEISEFIDAPVQNYSSGMKVRLGFAIAAQTEPDVLIIDEVLAVGDLGFVLKCFRRIDQILPKTAVIFVSHNMPSVSRISNMIMLMEGGTAKFQGSDIAKGIDLYYSRFANNQNIVFSGDSEWKLDRFNWETSNLVNNLPIFDWGKKMKAEVFILGPRDVEKFHLTFTVSDKEQRPIALFSNDINAVGVNVEESGDKMKLMKAGFEIEQIQFSQGIYFMSVTITEGDRTKPLLKATNVSTFQVTSNRQIWPPFELIVKWN